MKENININKWSEKINLLITTFTLYEPEINDYKNCGKKITDIYGQIQLYINDPKLIYIGNPLDVFILPELESDKIYNEAFNKILYNYYTPLFTVNELKNPEFLRLVIDYRDLLKRTTLIKIDNCRDKNPILENFKKIQQFPELDVNHIDRKAQIEGQTYIHNYFKQISQSKPKSQSKSKSQSQSKSQSNPVLNQTKIIQYYNPDVSLSRLSTDKRKITSYFTPINSRNSFI